MIDASYRVCNCLGHADSNPAIPKTLYRFSPALTRKGYASFHPGSIARFETQAKSFMRIHKPGDRHFKLVLVRQTKSATGLTEWECQCDCGKPTTIALGNLGRTKSCGCAAFKYDLRGKKFGKLTAVERLGPSWRCVCECGNERLLPTGHLMSGHSMSCGCNCYTHRKSRTIEYLVWSRMKARCYDPNSPSWDHYGGRGIKLCKKWEFDFAAFLADVGHRPAPGYSIERINNDGDYEPGNVRWATAKEQANNRSTTVLLTFNGKTQTTTQWCDELGIPYQRLMQRIKRGWSAESALTAPVEIKRLRKDHQCRNLQSIAAKC